MDLFQAILSDFARRLGLPGLAGGRSGAAEVAIERVGRLGMEQAEGRALVTLARPYPPHAGRAARAALEACHWRENRPWPVHAGAKGGERLSFTAAVPLAEFDVTALDRAVPLLSGMLDAAEGR